MKKSLLLSIVLFLIVGSGYSYYGKNKNEFADTPLYDTVTVKRGDITKIISTDGRVEPDFVVEVKSKASGEIKNILFEEGESVKKGDLLVMLDPSDEERNVRKMKLELKAMRAREKRVKNELMILEKTIPIEINEAESSLTAKETELSEIKSQFKRAEKLSRKKLISEEEVERIEADYKRTQADYERIKSILSRAVIKKNELELKRDDIVLAKTEVEKVRIALEEANERFADTKIKSPIDGILLSQFVEKGQIISSGISNLSGGTLLLSVADLSRMFVIADVDEADIGMIHVGQHVNITADAYMDRMFKGKVAHVAPQGIVESNITTFKVKIEVEGNDITLLKPGMTVNVNIIAAERNNVLVIPFYAVEKKKDKNIIYVVENNDVKTRSLIVGITDGINMEAIDGLKEGDEIIENTSLLESSEIINRKKGGKGRNNKARALRRFMRRMRTK